MATFLGLRTLDELNQFYYGRTPDEIVKADGGLSTSITGVYNPIYGAIAWANFNLEANVLSVLPKFVWDYSGWRIFTDKANVFADAGASNNSPQGGTVQGGLIADPIRPVVAEISVLPKTLQYSFQVTELMEYLVENSRDDLWGSLAHQRILAADQAKELFNQMLTSHAAGLDTATPTNRLNLESLDRIIASEAEYDIFGTASDDFNPWGNPDDSQSTVVERNSVSTYDSYVTSPDNNTTFDADVLTDSVLTDTLAQLRIAGGKEPTVFVGGQDTYSEIQHIYMNAYRIQNTADIRSEYNVTANGVSTFTGTGVGLHIATMYGLPFIPSKDVYAGAGNVGDLLILNTSADRNAPMKPMLGLQVLKPIVYYEASKRIQGWPFINGKFVDRALYEMLAENTCRNFKAQGKIIQIQKGV